LGVQLSNQAVGYLTVHAATRF